jgi:hypothetical protein
VKWQGAAFGYLETADRQQENSVEPRSPSTSGVLVAPAVIVTLTNVELGQVPKDLERVDRCGKSGARSRVVCRELYWHV